MLQRALSVVLLTTALNGCAQMDELLRGQRANVSDDPAAATGAPDTDTYVQELYALANGDPATQTEILADAETTAALTPNPSSRLRLALVLATPGHAETDEDRAQDILRDLLSQTELLTSGEIALATVHLRSVEQRLMLSQETARLREQSSRTADTEQRAVEQRLARVEAENRDLRKSLAEAEQKLEAITTIERSIREQTENGNNQQ
ncbi:hypothetical protein BA177_07015 [Woeseia oceani]|uniref:Uncharacterized protein n=1 Tax=Woeseia oceani TaxID=1548547 RepID=A0A193LEU8_9GAMM|nr:hypothetical protein BA177_07015 [Woeseia oceani]